MKKRETEISKIVVIDGDTFRCDFAGETHTIRLHGVDAPKVDEPFTKKLAKRLEEMILDKNIHLDMMGISWGELVCVVKVDGESQTVNRTIDSYLNDLKSAPRRAAQRRAAQRRRQ